MPFSLHSHSGEFCKHANGRLEDVVVCAIDHGFSHYGLSEHIPRREAAQLYPEELAASMSPADLVDQFTRFVAEARRLQSVYRDKIQLLVGCETEYLGSDSAEYVQQLCSTHSLDYVVGSVHHVDGTPIDFSSRMCDEAERRAGGWEPLAARYLDHQYELIRNLQPAVVGHLDVVRLFRQGSPWTASLADRTRRNIRAGVQYGALFEMNPRALKKGFSRPYPQQDVMRIVLEEGGRVTLSDDAHAPNEVGMYYSAARQYLKESGLRTLHYLESAFPKRDDMSRDGRMHGGVALKSLDDCDGHPFWSQSWLRSV